MNKRKETRPARTRAKQQQNPKSRLRTYSLMFVCVLTLVCGFFFAARQHFSSMDFGMKNSRLRRQVDELEAEKRRLLLAREISLSPMEIKKAAKKSGLVTSTGTEGMMAQVVSTTKEKAIPSQVSDTKTMVVKTALVEPVRATTAINYSKSEKPVKQFRPKVSND